MDKNTVFVRFATTKVRKNENTRFGSRRCRVCGAQYSR